MNESSSPVLTICIAGSAMLIGFSSTQTVHNRPLSYVRRLYERHQVIFNANQFQLNSCTPSKLVLNKTCAGQALESNPALRMGDSKKVHLLTPTGFIQSWCNVLIDKKLNWLSTAHVGVKCLHVIVIMYQGVNQKLAEVKFFLYLLLLLL